MSTPAFLDLTTLRQGYADGTLTPERVVEEVLRRSDDARYPHVWIAKASRERLLAMARALPPKPTAELPLYGVPFAIKDNIDLAEMPTTVGCPEISFIPEESASVVKRLIAAGALPIGKTNLDQFATGLVGVRSPYGACSSIYDARYISGGSSSGSAVAVAKGRSIRSRLPMHLRVQNPSAHSWHTRARSLCSFRLTRCSQPSRSCFSSL